MPRDGIPLIRVSVVRVGVEVGISLIQVGIDAEDGEEGATIGTADQRAQWRRPRHLCLNVFLLSLNVFCLFMFEFDFSPGLAAGKMGLPRPNFTSIRR
jgi:hypothetical protein